MSDTREEEAGTDPGVLIAAPIASESRQPVTATDIDVTGLAGTVLIDFFFVAPNTWMRTESASPQSDIEHDHEGLTIRSEPVARVALTLSAAFELMATLFETLGDEMSALQMAGQEAGERMAAASARMAGMTGGSSVPATNEGKGNA